MLEALAGKPAPDVLVDVVFDETEGNPFFVEEVFRHLVEEGRVFDDAGEFRTDIAVDELDVPESVRLVVGRRLERLGPEAQKVLAAGAVVGRGFPFALLEEIVDTDADRLLDIVEEAEAAKVIIPEGRDGDVHYSFAHELIRQTLLSGLSLLRRQRTAPRGRRTPSSAPTARGRNPPVGDRAPLAAGGRGCRRRSARSAYLERTADRAMSAAAYEEALAARSTTRFRSSTRRRTAPRRSCSSEGLDRPCARRLRRVHRDLERGACRSTNGSASTDAAAWLCWEMGYQDIWLSRFADAFAGIRRGVELLGDQRSPTTRRSSGTSLRSWASVGRFEAAEAQFAEAVAIAGSPATTGPSDASPGVARSRTGPTRTASPRSRADDLRSSTCAGPTTSGRLLTRSHGPAIPSATAARPTKECALAEEASRNRDEGRQPRRRVPRPARRLVDARVRGDRSRVARAVGATRISNVSRASTRPGLAQSHAWIAMILTLRGDLDRSLEHAEQCDRARARVGVVGHRVGREVREPGRGRRVRHLPADAGRATHVAAGERRVPAIGRLMMLYSAAQGSVVAGLRDDAAALYPDVVEQLPRLAIGNLFDLTLAERIAGMAAAAAGEWDAAQGHFERALRQADELPIRLERPQVQHWHAVMLLDRGDPDDRVRARSMLTEALGDYERLGMPLLAALAGRALASAGPPTIARRGGGLVVR